MFEEILRYLFPISIVLVLVNFVWAWALTAVKPPDAPAARSETDWRYLDAGPEGVRKTIGQEIIRRAETG